MKVKFSRSSVELVNLKAHIIACLSEGGFFVQFLGGGWAGYLEGLQNFWEEQLAVA